MTPDRRPPGSDPRSPGAGGNAASFAGRPWLGILFRCCQVYARVYRNPAGTAYDGRCPRCGAPINVGIGEGGTPQRFFEAV